MQSLFLGRGATFEVCIYFSQTVNARSEDESHSTSRQRRLKGAVESLKRDDEPRQYRALKRAAKFRPPRSDGVCAHFAQKYGRWQD
jgi:hypothetical protein